MELHLGKMTMRELSLWFGYATPDGLSRANPKTKAKKMEILKTFADYHMEKKTVYIDKIHIAEFSKAYETIEKEFPKEWGHIKDSNGLIIKPLKEKKIDTCARVGATIWSNNPDVKAQIKEKTAKAYANRAKVQLYGHNYKDDHGTLGSSQYVYMNADGTDVMSDEEYEIVKQCAAKAGEEISLLSMQIEEDYRNGDLTLEEKKTALGDLNTSKSFDLYAEYIIEKLGRFPEKRTRLQDKIYFE